MRKLFLSLFFLLTISSSFAQRGYSRSFWSAKFMLSSSTFLSDLGGKDFYGTNDPTDIDISEIRYALGAGIQWNNGRGLGIGLNTFYTRLSGDDNETDFTKRGGRNIHVRTDLLETNLMLEYTVAQDIPVLRGLYFTVGGGIALFQPKAQYTNGVWYKLQPFGTEGQVVDPTQTPYKRYSPVIPFGFGKKFGFQNGMALSIDVSLRKTFTDYLDDVSTVYYDTALILAAQGPIAAHFADPSHGANIDGDIFGRTGMERGDPTDFDNYFLIGFKLEIPIGSGGGYGNYNTNCAFSNSWIRSDGSVPKIRRKGKRRGRRR